MDANNNNYSGPERRSVDTDRRDARDRRGIVRFEDVLGRRSGVERRLGIDVESRVNMRNNPDKSS